MPSIKKQTSITLSFSQKNKDIYRDLEEKKQDKGFNQSEYICDCIRFFEKYKDKVNNSLSKDEIIKLIDERLSEFKKNVKFIDDTEPEEIDKNALLEQGLNEISSDFFGDD